MTVYVDQSLFGYGRMKMCHMWADTLEELHAAAAKIGIQRRWFQTPPKASWNHYDICMSKRALAIKNGAVETDKYEALAQQYKAQGNIAGLEMIKNCRSRP